MPSKTFTKLFLPLALLFFLSSCASYNPITNIKNWFAETPKEKPPEVMAQEGIKQLKKKDYLDAIETFEKLRDRYPYSDQAMLAQIKLADAYFYNKKYDEALQAYKDFEKLHPTNKAVPYCIYREGLCYFRQRSTIDRDQTFTLKAMEEFRRLKQKFPQDENIPRVEKYLAQCRSDLAEHELYVAHFYFKTKRYAAALERFQILAQEYPEFPKQGEIKSYIAQCQQILAEPEKQNTGWLSPIANLFDATW